MNDLIDDDIRDALAPYLQVRASDELRATVTDPASQTPGTRRWARRHPRVAIGGAVAALAAASIAVAVSVIDRPDPVDTTRPTDIGNARMVVFADGTTVDVEEMFFPVNHRRLQAAFAEHGAELAIVDVPVPPAADGRVLGVTTPAAMTDESGRGDIHVVAGGRVEVTIGRSDAGLMLYAAFPEVEQAIHRDDPEATRQALEQLGFQVQWLQLWDVGDAMTVTEPLAGSVVIAVVAPDTGDDTIDPATDPLVVEVAPPEVAEELGR